MKKLTAAAVTNAIQDKSDEARKSALFEVKSLKKDLLNLEKTLSAKKCVLEDPAFDLVHSAFEIFRYTEIICQNSKLQDQIDESLEKASFKEYLDSKGARLLKKPEGWHWISPSGEMHYLGPGTDTQAAAEKLESLVSRKKSPSKPKAAKPAAKKQDMQSKEESTAAEEEEKPAPKKGGKKTASKKQEAEA